MAGPVELKLRGSSELERFPSVQHAAVTSLKRGPPMPPTPYIKKYVKLQDVCVFLLTLAAIFDFLWRPGGPGGI